MRRLEIGKRINGLDDKVMELSRKKDMLDRSSPMLRRRDGPPGYECLLFVDQPWFDGVVALVILLNLIMVVMELPGPTHETSSSMTYTYTIFSHIYIYICSRYDLIRYVIHQILYALKCPSEAFETPPSKA